MRGAADTLKRVTLELGGKSPNIVFADADMDSAVKGAINGIFYGKGEVCNAGSRLFVDTKSHDEFIEKLVARAKKMVPGDPLDPKTRMGAIVSQEQMQTVLSYIDAGKNEGAKLIAGGNRVSIDGGNGFFVEPTIFGGVSNDMKIAQEEIFGPVLAVLGFDDVDQVMELANQESIWTRRRGLDTRSQESAHGFTTTPSWNCVDQYLRLDGCRPAVWRIQEFRVRPGTRPRGAGTLHRNQISVDEHGLKQGTQYSASGTQPLSRRPNSGSAKVGTLTLEVENLEGSQCALW